MSDDIYVVRNVLQRVRVGHSYEDVEKDITFQRVSLENFHTHFPTTHKMGSGILLLVDKETGQVAVRSASQLRLMVMQTLNGFFGSRLTKKHAKDVAEKISVYFVSDRQADIVLHPDIGTVKARVQKSLGDVGLAHVGKLLSPPPPKVDYDQLIAG